MTPDRSIRLKVFGDMMENGIRLSFWCFNEQLELDSTTCRDADLLENMFMINGCKQAVLEFCKTDPSPFMITDLLNLAWLVVPVYGDDLLSKVFMLGPCFNSYTTEKTLLQGIEQLNLTSSLTYPLIQRLQKLPILQHSSLMSYGVMLYYVLMEQTIQTADIQFHVLKTQELFRPGEHQPSQAETAARSVYAFEQIYFDAVTQGNINFKAPVFSVPETMGILAKEDALRHVKNQMVIKVGLAARAAIRGGLPEVISYPLSDFYIQIVETCKTIPEAYDCGHRGYWEMVHRVHNLKKQDGLSREIQNCLAYINSHLSAKIDYNQMAAEIGYNRWYLCTKFKQEMQITIGSYLLHQRVEYAKILLRNTNYSILEISQLLQFNSSSHFGSVFRKLIGVSPSKYRDSGDSNSKGDNNL